MSDWAWELNYQRCRLYELRLYLNSIHITEEKNSQPGRERERVGQVKLRSSQNSTQSLPKPNSIHLNWMTMTITHSLNVQSANKWNERAGGEKDVWAGRPGNLITWDVKAIQLPGNLDVRDHIRLEERMSYFGTFKSDVIVNQDSLSKFYLLMNFLNGC